MVYWVLKRMNTGRSGRRPGFPSYLLLLLSLILMGASAMAQISYLPGWPQAIEAPQGRPIYIADIDDDGEQELVMMAIGNNAQEAMLYAFKSDGATISGFPIAGGHFLNGNSALFDSDDDGKLEIAIPQNGNMYLRDQQGNAIWSILYSGPIFQSKYYPFHVSADDLDNDGKPEIVVTCYSGGAIFVFDAQGNIKPGWPVLLTRPAGWSPPMIFKSASIGDIDNDGLQEIVVGVDDGTITDPSRVYCIKPDASFCPGFPVGVTPKGFRSKAVLADVDWDGFLEILIGKTSTELNVYRHDGSLFPGYPQGQHAAGIAVGDIDRNGSLDMTIGWGSMFAYDVASATPLPNFPITDTAEGFLFSAEAPNLCDLSGDFGVEIVTGAGCCGLVPDGKLYGYQLSGQLLPNFPSDLLYHRSLGQGCSVKDVDGNGTTDICCGSANNGAGTPQHSTVYCWDTGHPYNLDNIDWAMDGFDLGHTGRWRRLYHISKSGSQLSAVGCQPSNPCYLPPDGSLISVDVTAVREHGGANPSGQDIRYSRTLGCGNYEGPVVDHGDGTYTRMLRAPTADCTTNVHAWVNEFKLQDYQQIVFTSGCVAPPPVFSLLNPLDGAVQQPLNLTLEWPAVGSFPNQATAYDLFFGPDPDPPYYQGGLTATFFGLHGLSLGTTYYWRVEARNACGTTSSPVWSFTTACPVPEPFAYLCPADGAAGLPLDVELAWEAATHAERYKVFLGAGPGAPALIAAVSGTRYAVSGLAEQTTYYWQIAAQNACGETPGPVWSFTTGTDEECHHCRPVSPP